MLTIGNPAALSSGSRGVESLAALGEFLGCAIEGERRAVIGGHKAETHIHRSRRNLRFMNTEQRKSQQRRAIVVLLRSLRSLRCSMFTLLTFLHGIPETTDYFPAYAFRKRAASA
jgi:hypothetical protein